MHLLVTHNCPLKDDGKSILSWVVMEETRYIWVLRRPNSADAYTIRKSSLKTLCTLERGDMSASIAMIAPKGLSPYFAPPEQMISMSFGQLSLLGIGIEVFLLSTLEETQSHLSRLPEPFQQTLKSACLGLEIR